MRRFIPYLTLSLLLLICLRAGAQQKSVVFATKKVETIAGKLKLQGLDTIKADTDDRSTYFYKDKTLHIRKDKWGEISHIGLTLFHPAFAAQRSVVCDFIERYALEYALATPEQQRYLQTEGVTFWTGNIRTLQGMKGTETVSVNQRNMRDYHVVWQEEGRELLTMAFPMDVQLIFGCNAIELETRFMKNLMRTHVRDNSGQLTVTEDYTANETFLIDAIRSQLFYKDNQLVWNNKDWRKSLYNLVVSGRKFGDYQLKLTLDKYGYKVADEMLPFEQWAQYCRSEGCRIYLGIKEIRNGVVRATAFAANHSLGYCHMLSLSVSQADLGGKSGVLRGRMYAYIPLHNISDSLFENEYTNN